ncbi:MAG: hypothetical protein HY552_04815 [Elusimicrobia bacterium]|nr:hypothetical protein [Elusimicrobiota bacterium]
MKTDPLREVLDWLKTTDLAEVAYRKDGRGFSLATAAPMSAGALPPGRFTPICAESVGVFQWSQPGKPRKAEEGAAVAAGDVLGVVVAGSGTAKPVKAPSAGVVAKCFAEAGQAVEYGQPLFLLEPRVEA